MCCCIKIATYTTKILLYYYIPIHFGIFLLHRISQEIPLLLSTSGKAMGAVLDCEWGPSLHHANRFEVDCRDLSFEEFHSKMSIVKGMQFISMCVNQCGHILSNDWHFNDRLYNDIYFL